MKFKYNDGGRADAGFKGTTGDCGIRALAIVSGLPYKEIYEVINLYAHDERPRKGTKRSNSRTGIWRKTLNKFAESIDLKWTSCMGIGTGCKVHLKEDDLPDGKIICRVSKHYVAVVDKVIHDIFDCSRNETRCVYGYWHY